MLVTPTEKVGIMVEDAPFLAVEMTRDADGVLQLRTNVDDLVTIDAGHPLRFAPGPGGSLKPYGLVRGGLWALVNRPVFYELMALGETRAVDGVDLFGIASGSVFFPMMEASAIDGLDRDAALG